LGVTRPVSSAALPAEASVTMVRAASTLAFMPMTLANLGARCPGLPPDIHGFNAAKHLMFSVILRPARSAAAKGDSLGPHPSRLASLAPQDDGIGRFTCAWAVAYFTSFLPVTASRFL